MDQLAHSRRRQEEKEIAHGRGQAGGKLELKERAMVCMTRRNYGTCSHVFIAGRGGGGNEGNISGGQ